MAKITLINTSGDIYAFGLRRIGAYLRSNSNHSVKMLFCLMSSTYYSPILSAIRRGVEKTTETFLENVVSFAGDADCVCLSVMSSTEPIAIDITARVARE